MCVPAYAALCSKQTSHTLTGPRPQPLSGTGADLEEQPSQKPSPQARQWCLVSLSWKTVWHLWHTLDTKDKMTNGIITHNWPSTQSYSRVLSCDLQRQDCVRAVRSQPVNRSVVRKVLTRQLEVGGKRVGAACVTHRDEGVGFPVGWGDLVRQPRRDGLGRLDTELWHRLGHKVYSIQKTLRRVAIVL